MITYHLKDEEDDDAESGNNNELTDVEDELSRPVDSERNSRYSQLTTTFHLTTMYTSVFNHFIRTEPFWSV